MPRSRYWKLTTDEVKKLTYNPDKVLNWEIKGLRKPETEAKFIGIFLFKHGTPYNYEEIHGIVYYHNNINRKELPDITKFLKKNGLMFIATLNKTLKSYVLAIVGAEYILNWLPIGTHDWEKFIKPNNLIGIAKNYKLKLVDLRGLKFNPLLDKWNLTNDKSVNYIANFRKN
jgi:hypothetical protein